MKKNFFKKKLASALALALVVASFSPAGISAQAATSTKVVKQGGGTAPTVLYVGGSKVDYSLSTIKAGVKYTWKSSNTKIATITASTGVVTAKAPGSVTITATATDKKTKKVLNTFKKTLTVNLRATSVEAGDDFTLAPGETKKLTAVKTPSNSTDVVNFVSSNKEVVTVGLTGGVVTAKGAGEATITVYSKATKASSNKSAKTVVDTVKVTVGLGATAVKQTKADTFEVTFNGKVESVKASDFVIKRNTTNEVIYAKSASVKDNVVTLTTYLGLKDGKEYTLTYGGKDLSFKATDGAVANLSFAPTSIVFGTGSAIKVSTADANGIILDEYEYGKTPASVIDFTITTNQGYLVNNKLVLFAEGNTATAKATYHTKKYDEFGKEVGAVTAEATIYAVSAAAVNITDTNYAIADKAPDFSKDTLVKTLAIKDQSKNFYFYAKDSAGNVVKAGAYTFESSDANRMIVGNSTSYLGGKIVAVSEGTAYVLVKDSKGNVVYSLPITIVPERKAAIINLSTYSFKLSNASLLGATKEVKVELIDQYQNKMADPTDIDVTVLSTPDSVKIPAASIIKGVHYTVTAGAVKFNGAQFTEGSYLFSITSAGLTKTISVTIAKPDSNAVALYALELSSNSIDAAFSGDNKTIEARLVEYKGDVASKYLAPGTDFTITVKKGDDTLVATASGSAFIIDVTKAQSNGYVSKAAVGSYVVTATTSATATTTSLNFTNGFVVSDSQAGVTASVVTYTPDATNLADGVAKAFAFKYDGNDTTVEIGKINAIPVDQSNFISSVVVYVTIGGKKVPFTVDLNTTITLKK